MNGQINEKQSLVGDTMPSNGKSAYEYAKDGGYNGTEQEFADKLAKEYIPINTSYGETDKYFYDGTEVRLDLSAYGLSLGNFTSAYKLNLEITKEQVEAMEKVTQLDMNTLSFMEMDLSSMIVSSSEQGNIYSIGDLGFIIVAYVDNAMLRVEALNMTIPVPQKGAYIVVLDEIYNGLVNNYVLLFEGSTVTAKIYSQIDNKYLRTPIIDVDSPIIKENGGLKAPDFSKDEPNNVQDGGFVVGRDNTGGKYSFVVGAHNKAGYNSSVTGMNNDVTVGEHCTVGGVWHYVQNPYCTVFGVGNKVYAQKTFVAGEGNVANAIHQSVMGRFNVPIENCVLIVGNGTSDTARSNAHTIDWNGNGWFAGKIEAQAIILKSPNGKKFKITVDNDGNLKVVNPNSGGLV